MPAPQYTADIKRTQWHFLRLFVSYCFQNVFHLIGFLFACYSFWFYVFMFVLCLVVCFVCLFSEERDKERAWSWVGRDRAGSGKNWKVGKAWSEYTVWKSCFQLKNACVLGKHLSVEARVWRETTLQSWLSLSTVLWVSSRELREPDWIPVRFLDLLSHLAASSIGS